MMGKSHFVSGAVAFEASALVMHYSPTQTITGLVIGTCAALCPDIDHPKATISRAYGPLTVLFSRVMGKALGGHRKGTHSIVGIVLFGWIAQLCVTHRRIFPHTYHAVVADAALSMILIVTLAAGIKIFKIKGLIDDFLPVPIVLALVMLVPVDLRAVPLALMFGCAVHVLGDCLTNSGCPIFWPVSAQRLKLGLFKTGKKMETYVVFPLLMISSFVLAGCKVWMMARGM